ncbi:MAG: RagB/SusD family nutrient uptake outer membrane protein [Chitinophagaceae bacterium]|nr:RagB/SusD family nutrient uptake outer membrane protein [Chitinophagaceae bacterium]
MRTIRYVAGFCLLLVVSGCEKLDRDFVTSLDREQIEKSFGNVQSLLAGVYSNVPDGTNYIGGSAMMASATDEAEHTLETNGVQNFNTGSWNAINNPDQVWGSYYRGIRQANQFLLSTSKIDLDQWKLDPSASGQLVYTTNLATIRRWSYEARFLRAYFYFELVKRYGGVPLLNNSLSLDEDFSKIQRNTLDSCIKYIVSECDSAAAQLPLNTSTAPYIAASDLGRATKMSALALKSRVLLYAASDLFNTPSWAGGYAQQELIALPAGNRADRWKAASDAAKAAIDAGALPALGAYKALFNTFNNTEIIFARGNSNGGNNNSFERNNAPIGYSNAAQSGNTPSQDLVDAYDVIQGSNAVKFNWNDSVMAAAPYANRDPRLALTVVVNNSAFGVTPPNRTNNIVQLFNGGLDGKPIINASKTGYYLRKYQQEGINLATANTASHSWIIFRFPELYLNYAEALNEWSPGNTDIKAFYDRVRSRTGVAVPALPAGLNQAEVREKIRNERRVEFAFEDHRFWDVRRWMQGVTYFNAPLRGVDINRTSPTTFTYTPITVELRVFEPRMYLYPIPQTDINLSSSLGQNPLW